MDAKDETNIAIPADSPFWRHAQAPCNVGFCDHASASATGVGSCGHHPCGSGPKRGLTMPIFEIQCANCGFTGEVLIGCGAYMNFPSNPQERAAVSRPPQPGS